MTEENPWYNLPYPHDSDHPPTIRLSPAQAEDLERPIWRLEDQNSMGDPSWIRASEPMIRAYLEMAAIGYGEEMWATLDPEYDGELMDFRDIVEHYQIALDSMIEYPPVRNPLLNP